MQSTIMSLIEQKHTKQINGLTALYMIFSMRCIALKVCYEICANNNKYVEWTDKFFSNASKIQPHSLHIWFVLNTIMLRNESKRSKFMEKICVAAHDVFVLYMYYTVHVIYIIYLWVLSTLCTKKKKKNSGSNNI